MWKKHILSATVVVYAVIALVFSLNTFAAHPTQVKGEALTAPTNTGNALVDEINRVRYENGVAPLEIDGSLTTIAKTRTDDMVTNNYYAHQSPNGTYFSDLMKQNRIEYDFACENLDLAFSGAEGTYVADWMASTKGHRECLLNAKVTKVGVATGSMSVTGASNSTIATAIFSN